MTYGKGLRYIFCVHLNDDAPRNHLAIVTMILAQRRGARRRRFLASSDADGARRTRLPQCARKRASTPSGQHVLLALATSSMRRFAAPRKFGQEYFFPRAGPAFLDGHAQALRFAVDAPDAAALAPRRIH